MDTIFFFLILSFVSSFWIILGYLGDALVVSQIMLSFKIKPESTSQTWLDLVSISSHSDQLSYMSQRPGKNKKIKK